MDIMEYHRLYDRLWAYLQQVPPELDGSQFIRFRRFVIELQITTSGSFLHGSDYHNVLGNLDYAQ